MITFKNLETEVEFKLANAPVRNGNYWETPDLRFYDPTGSIYQITNTQPHFPTIGPIHFQMLFTSAEAVAAEAARATDPVLNRFWKLIEDPRTDVVNLSLESVQDAVEHTLTVAKQTITDLDVPARKAQILTGELV